MSSESVCQVARRWVDVGRFTCIYLEFNDFYSVSPENFGSIPVFYQRAFVGLLYKCKHTNVSLDPVPL